MPATYNNHGICFAYPENWTLEESDNDQPKSVTVQSPGNAFWTVSKYPPSSDAAALSDAAVAAIRQEYGEIETESIVSGASPSMSSDFAGLDVHFTYLDLPITASVRSLRSPTAVFILFWQAEDDDYEQHAKVFEAMAISLQQALA